MSTARNGDVEVAYEVAGDGPPVVLVQGVGGVGRSWVLVADALATRGRTVVTMDNRGVGGTYMPRGAAWTVADMAADVLAVADACRLDTFHLAGLSMGGMISQELLVMRPERLRSVTLLGTHYGMTEDPAAPPYVAPDPTALAALANPVDRADPAGSARRMFELLAGPGFLERHPERLDLMLEIGSEVPMPMRGFMSQFAAVSQWSAYDRLGPAPVPAVVVHGDADPLIPPENGRNLAERIAAPLRLLAGCGHMLFLEAPADLVEIIDAQIGG
ncbi:MAG: alpha/beta hydrolase [Acidimicrobiia bacterium]